MQQHKVKNKERHWGCIRPKRKRRRKKSEGNDNTQQQPLTPTTTETTKEILQRRHLKKEKWCLIIIRRRIQPLGSDQGFHPKQVRAISKSFNKGGCGNTTIVRYNQKVRPWAIHLGAGDRYSESTPNQSPFVLLPTTCQAGAAILSTFDSVAHEPNNHTHLSIFSGNNSATIRAWSGYFEFRSQYGTREITWDIRSSKICPSSQVIAKSLKWKFSLALIPKEKDNFIAGSLPSFR